MKAYQVTSFTGASGLTEVELPEPTPVTGHVVVRLRAASLNYRDLMVAGGRYGKITLPLVPLSDGAGEIVALGNGVKRWRVGDRVAGLFFQNWTSGPLPVDAFQHALGAGLPGVMAEYVQFPEGGVVEIPSHLSFEEAATLPCASLTAWNALVARGNVAADETVLLLGTGGVSIFALQFAKMHGARVIVISSRDEKLARARALGADLTINYRTTPDWDTAVLELTHGAGVDHVIEVGGHDTLPRSLKCAAVEGTVNVIGGLTGPISAEIPLRVFVTRNVVIRGIAIGSRRMHEAMNRAIERNGLRPVIDRVFPFAELPDAYRHIESGSHFGKVVVSF